MTASNQRSWYQALTLFLSLLVCFTHATGETSLTTLHSELTNTIRDLQINGEPDDFDLSLKSLIHQLDVLQVPAGEPMNLEWADSTSPAITGMKQICFVVSSFEGLYINSGIGTAYYGLAELLARNGQNVTVLYTRDTPTIGGSFSDWVARYKEKGITLRFLPPSATRIATPKLQATSFKVYRFLKTANFDIVHFADFEGLGYYSTQAKHVGLAFDNTVFVAGLHGPSRWVLEANTGRRPSHESEIEVDYMERMSMEHADYVWTPSAYLASWLSLQGWKFGSEVSLLPLPPGPEMQAVVAPTASRTTPKELVYFGRLEKRKGLLLFCDALDIIAKMTDMLPQNLTVTFLGTSGFVDGQNSTLYVRSRAATWPFRVQIISDASRADSLKYLSDNSAARLPIIPSLVDNAPYTVFECLYAGIPFLASSTPSIVPLIAGSSAQNDHLFDTKPHNLASRLVTAFKSGVTRASGIYTVAQAEQAWLSYYGRMKPQTKAVSTEKPLVSVIITHFNRPELVSQAIASVEAQDYSNYEIILADDGSTDASALQYIESIKAEFTAKGWKVIHTGNKYLGAARNAAAKEANGQYLLFLDDDNTAFPNQISTYVTAAQATTADIVTSAHSLFKGTVAPAGHFDRIWVPLGASLAVGLFKNGFGDANFFVSKSAFFAVGGFTEETNVGLEEHEFFAKAIFAGQKLEVVPESLLNYRIHDTKSQMTYNTDIRMGEARRMRPYLAALAPVSEVEADEAVAARTRRSVVTLVARNAIEAREDCNQTLSSVNPTSGPVSGGTLITITGTGFSCGVTSVLVDGNACTGLSIISNTEISCTTPPGNRVYVAVDIVAEVAGSAVTLYSMYTYLPTAAPQLTSCTVSNDGLYIDCTFNTPTNVSSGASCSYIFGSATTALLGSGWTCQFTDSHTAQITLGSGATIVCNDPVTVIANAVSGQGVGGLPNQEATTPLNCPTNPVKPQASISSPSTVSFCEGIVLSATGTTGNAGRAFTVTVWTLVSSTATSGTTTITQVLAAASSASSLTVTLGSSSVTAGDSYVFSVSFTNWLGQTGSTTATITKSASAVPQVSISGPSVVTLSAATALTLDGSASSSCNATLGSITYAWSLDPTVSGLSTSSSTLTIPANTLTAGTTYVATLTVTDSASGQTNTANVTIVVTLDALIVKLTGGNTQYHTSDVVVLDASGSSDPDNLGPLSFSWTCANYYNASQPCNVNLPADDIISVNADTLGVGKWIFTVTVSGAHNRTGSASAWVEVLQSSVLSISIQALGSTPINSYTGVSLTGLVNTPGVAVTDVAWSWNCTEGTIADPSSAYLTSTNSRILVIGPNVLVQGTTYTFMLTGTDAAISAVGYATITFTVAQVPAGSMACGVSNGVAEEAIFPYNFGASSSVQKYELTYTYAGGCPVPAADLSSTPGFNVLLPAGSLTITGLTLDPNTYATVSSSTCAATVTFSSSAAAYSALTAAATGTSLTSFDVARIASSAQNVYSGDNSFQICNIYGDLLSPFQAVATSSGSLASVEANTASLNALASTVCPLTAVQLAALLAAATNVFTAQGAYVNQLPSCTFDTDAAIIAAFTSQIGSTDFNTVTGIDVATTTASVDNLSALLALMMAERLAVGQEYDSGDCLSSLGFDNSANAVGITVHPALPSLAFGPGFLGSSTASKGVAVVNRCASLGGTCAALPANDTLASKITTVNVYLDGSSTPTNLGATPVTIVYPISSLTSSNGYQCIMCTGSGWTTVGVTTTVGSGSVTCGFPQEAQAFAVIAGNSTAGAAGAAAKKSSGGLSGGDIAGIAIGGAAAAAAAIAAGLLARRYRRRPAAARPAAVPVAVPVAGPVAVTNAAPIGIPVVAPVAFAAPEAGVAAVPVAAPVAVTNAAVRGVPTPALAAVSVVPAAAAVAAVPLAGGLRRNGSSYDSSSSGSRSYAGSSTSSEEEIMEAEIKGIVGELTHALPRDSRALEVLGDKLEME